MQTVGEVTTTVYPGRLTPTEIGDLRPFNGDAKAVFNGTHTVIDVTYTGKNGGTFAFDDLPAKPIGTNQIIEVEG